MPDPHHHHDLRLRGDNVLLSLTPAIAYFVAGAASASFMWWIRERQWPQPRRGGGVEEHDNELEKEKHVEEAAEKDRWSRYVDKWKSRIGELPGLAGGSATVSSTSTSSPLSSKRRIPWPWNRRRKSNSPYDSPSVDEKSILDIPNEHQNASTSIPLSASTTLPPSSLPSSSSAATATTTTPLEREKSGLCIGSIFGLDVGGTLAKLVYFEQKPNQPNHKMMSHRQLHYTQAAAASAVLAARRGGGGFSSSSQSSSSSHRIHLVATPPPPLTSLRERGRSIGEVPSKEDCNDDGEVINGDDHHLRNRPHNRRRRHSESNAPILSSSSSSTTANNNSTTTTTTTTSPSSPSSSLRHSVKSNQDLEQMYHLRQDSLPDDLHQFAATVLDDDASRTSWIHSQDSMKRIVLGDLQKEDNTINCTVSSDDHHDKDETTSKKKTTPHEFSNTMFSSSANNNNNNASNKMKRSRSMFDLSKSRDHAEALDRFYHFARRLDSYREGVRDTKLSFYSRELGGEFHFIRFETRRMTHAMDLIRANQLHVNICEMGATGGGAHKYAPEWDRVLGIRIKKQDELESLVAGMQFVLSTVVGECYTFLPREGRGEANLFKGGPAVSGSGSNDSPDARNKSTKPASTSFSSSDDEDEDDDEEDIGTSDRRSTTPSDSSEQQQPGGLKTKESTDSTAENRNPPTRPTRRRRLPKVIGDEWWWSRKVQRDAISYSNTYPYLLVTIGTGVSILRVDGPRQHERISGSTIGGGTYWGLIRLLTDVEDFEDVMKLAERGDPSKVDMMVGDIYGKNSDALEKLGLSSNLVASSFGKLVAKEDPAAGLKQEDLARALLLMVTNNIGQVAYLNAKLHHTPRIYFVGNFLRHNKISQRRLSYAINYWSKGEMEALFLEHEGYFGALGAFLLSQGIAQGEHGFFQWDPKFRTSGTHDGNDDNGNEAASIPDSSDSSSMNGFHRRSETMSSLELL